jgi:Animal haem peroxidase
MSGHSTHRPHGSGIRELKGSDFSHIDEGSGRFGRLFEKDEERPFSDDDLFKLAVAMKGDDEVKDGPDPEESDIPAAYTYFGQFIDHDLTFDPSTFEQQKSDPKGTRNFRTPSFDLDNVYGRGPSDQPYLYDGNKLLLGDKLFVIQRNPKARDVPRVHGASDGNQRAIIGDPRNDENVIVSQLQGMMQRFHNGMAAANPDASFADLQLAVRRHYQWAVIHDFLPRIVQKSVLDSVSKAIADPKLTFADHPPHLQVYHFKSPIMPVEFSVAAYRLGHSMVRPGYRVNEFTAPLRIFDHDNPTNGLNAFGNFPKSWAIDWQRFIDLGLRNPQETDKDRVQKAYKIDPSLVEPLANLPLSIAGDEALKDERKFSLAFRNLERGKILHLPSGQDVAKHMGVPVIPNDKIIIFPAHDGSEETDGENGKPAPTITDISPKFKDRCPLWVYILAEARRNFYSEGRTVLGPVGGRIVAEVFLALLKFDRGSIVNTPEWKPIMQPFGLANILKIALEN